MPVTVNRPGPWNHRDLSAGGTRFHAAIVEPDTRLASTPLVVLLHGFPECWWTWRHVLPALADAGMAAAALDLRGFGGSDRPPAGYDLSTLADDVAGATRALGYEQVIVVGHGLGGQVAWVMAGRHSSMLRAIVPIGAPHPVALRTLRGRFVSGAAMQYAAFRLPYLPERTLTTTRGMESILRGWAGPHTRQGVLEAASYYAQLLARPGAARSALETLRKGRLGRETLSALTSQVAVPMLSIQGEVDPVQPAQAYARDTHHVAGAHTQITVRGVGHFPQEEAPQRFLEALMPFLTEQVN